MAGSDYDWLLRGLEPEVREEYLRQREANEAGAAAYAEAQRQAMIDRYAAPNLTPEDLEIIRRHALDTWDVTEYAQGGIVPQFGGGNMNGISMTTQPARRRIGRGGFGSGIGMGRPRNTFPVPSGRPDRGISMGPPGGGLGNLMASYQPPGSGGLQNLMAPYQPPSGLGRPGIGGAPLYQPPGSTDTVPAMLTPGEGVLNTGAMTMPGMRPAVNAANQIGMMRNQGGFPALGAYAGGTSQVEPPSGISPEAGQAIAAILAGISRGSQQPETPGYAAGTTGVEPIGYTDPIEEAEWMKIVQMVPPNTDIAKLKAQAQSSGISAETIARLVQSLGSGGGGYGGYAAPQYSMGDLAAGGGAATGGFVTESGVVPGYAEGSPSVEIPGGGGRRGGRFGGSGAGLAGPSLWENFLGAQGPGNVSPQQFQQFQNYARNQQAWTQGPIPGVALSRNDLINMGRLPSENRPGWAPGYSPSAGSGWPTDTELALYGGPNNPWARPWQNPQFKGTNVPGAGGE